MKNPKTFVEEWCTDDSVAMIIQYDRRQIQFFFNSSREKYKLEFSFKDMTNGELLMERDGPSTYFTIQLKFPARFWRSNQSAVHDTKLVATVGNQWERILTIPVRAGSSSSAGSSGRKAPVNLHPDTGKARLGMWTTYRIKFAPERRAQKLFEEMLVEASEYNLVPRDTRLLLPILSVVRPSSLPTPRLHNDRAQILSFEVLYMLESLILSYQFGEYNLDDEFYETIKELDPQIAIGIFDILWASKQRAWEPLQAIKRIFNEMGVKVRHRRRIPEHCAMIRKILVTPTTVYVQPPSIETTNRVVRHYREHADRFVRVQFLDDGMSKVSASHQKTGSDAIYKRIYKALQSGIQIGTRRYDFLAFSSSQLRDHGCWFFAPTKDLSANKIRNWMGSFRKEKIVAKHAVRMGQVKRSFKAPILVNTSG
ncbi:RNA dependent RNA polymerase-domain-containing protein [Zychaea mexicana]|uniref:RNA dependent RNA polymerase-domain-containing protein n=1 Tax=Zychaea mexicana TaxID=64656 RepID=UPI0022FDC17C|nr:RNA dependent RNA polymerase-domain-containing protein [Zychaea mexicana]KAI9493547.1 RNA dependent RNA polymerase-domain-containing protein [Zychaea mexicana]